MKDDKNKLNNLKNGGFILKKPFPPLNPPFLF